MPRSESRSGRFPFVCLACLLLAVLPLPTLVLGQEDQAAKAAAVASGTAEQGPAGPAISFPAEDMQRRLQEEAARIGEMFQTRTYSLFERKPLGFDIGTIRRLEEWMVRLPLEVPALVRHVMEQGRMLGVVGSLIMLVFLGALFYSLFGQRKVIERLEQAVGPLERHLPDVFHPYFRSLVRIVAASLMPVILFGLYSLIRAFISYRAPWFLITGNLLMLWAVGALVINVLRETLTQGIFPISLQHGQAIFRVLRIAALYILFSFAIFLGAEAFRIPEDFLALLRFVLSVSIVLVCLLLLLKKRALLGALPDLPYRGYQIFVRGLERFYFPAIFLTFLTGLLWCVGYHTLCIAVWKKTWAVAGAFVGIMLAYHILQGWLRRWAAAKAPADEPARALYRAVHSLLLYAAVVTILLVSLDLLGLLDPIQRILSFPVLRIGQTPISLWTLVKAVLILLAFLFMSRLLRSWLDYRVYPSIGMEEGLAYAVNTFLHYVLVAFGFLAALRAMGLDLRVLMVFAGALGIGLGLGLQNMAANLISGFSLVFGRRIRKGDWIQIGDTLGAVQEVSLRATKVRTRDNVEYLIPNADLTANTIVNYTLSDPLIRVHIPVGVSYSSKPEQVREILLRAAKEHEHVNKLKEPEVWFVEYGDSSLNFELLVWIDVRKVSERRIRSELYFTIFEALCEAGIEIPFPQRDIHIRSGLGPEPAGSKP